MTLVIDLVSEILANVVAAKMARAEKTAIFAENQSEAAGEEE